MPKDETVRGFAQMVGAKEPREGTEHYMQFRSMFRRSNYFFLNGKILIVKISRSDKPFLPIRLTHSPTTCRVLPFP